MNQTIEAFRAIGEATRFRILRLLVDCGLDLCACELKDALDKPQYAISKAMTALVAAGVLTERRESRMMFYSLIDSKVNKALYAAVAAATLTPELKEDSDRLERRLADRVEGSCVRC